VIPLLSEMKVWCIASMLSFQATLTLADEPEGDEVCALQVAQLAQRGRLIHAPPCSAGDHVKCPGSGNMCAGNQCCPGTSQTNNQAFSCPSADSDFTGCPAPKVEDSLCACVGQSCQNNGDCCLGDCQNVLGGNGKMCAPPPQYCSQEGQDCQNNADCCDGNCQIMLGGSPSCAPPPSCVQAGQSCENNGDCCDNDECKNVYGGSGKLCFPPSTSNCVAPGANCTGCVGCQNLQCCGGNTCHKLYHGDGYVCGT